MSEITRYKHTSARGFPYGEYAKWSDVLALQAKHAEEVERLRAQLSTMSTAQDVYEYSLRLIERAYGDENATVQQICERLAETKRLTGE